MARVLVGMESKGYLGTIWSWIRALAAFVGGLLGAMCLVVSCHPSFLAVVDADKAVAVAALQPVSLCI